MQSRSLPCSYIAIRTLICDLIVIVEGELCARKEHSGLWLALSPHYGYTY